MPRCEGYYKRENRRCDRDAAAGTVAADGERYLVCEYHRRQDAPIVARWAGETGVRTSAPTPLHEGSEHGSFAFG